MIQLAKPERTNQRSATVALRRARPMMGTLVGVTVRGVDIDTLKDMIRGIFAEIERLESLLSEWRPDSAVSAVNRAAGKNPVRVPAELIEVMQVAGQVARATEGAFDCTWAALADIWKVDELDFRPPDREATLAARGLVDFRDVELDAGKNTLFLRRAGMRLGLGGVAKAHVAERAANLAVAQGASDVLIDAGGNLVARGRGDRRPWTIGIRDSRSTALLATAELQGEAIATSGDYEHFAECGGRRYHHILDPRTGEPASASRSATVIAPHGALADALATGLFVLGPQGLDTISRFDGAAGMVVGDDGVAHVSAKGASRFGQLDLGAVPI